MNNEQLMRMLIPKEKFRYRMKKGSTFADAKANSDRRIAKNKENCAMYWHLRVLEAAP